MVHRSNYVKDNYNNIGDNQLIYLRSKYTLFRCCYYCQGVKAAKAV